MVQWLRLYTPNAGVSDSISGQGTRSHLLQLRPGRAKEIIIFFLIKRKELEREKAESKGLRRRQSYGTFQVCPMCIEDFTLKTQCTAPRPTRAQCASYPLSAEEEPFKWIDIIAPLTFPWSVIKVRSQDSDLLSCFHLKAVPHWISRTSIVPKCRELIGIILAFVTHKLNALLASFGLSGFPNHGLIAKGI